MATSSHAPRHITLFTVPAGTPTPIFRSKVDGRGSNSGGGSASGSKHNASSLGSKQNKENPGNFTVKLGRLLFWTPSVDHWGIYIEGEADVEAGRGLCVELGRSPDGGIIVLHRTRREREEKEPQVGIRFEKTDVFTYWEDDRIVQCAKDICQDQLFGDYNVIVRNCQTFVNLLLQRITTGGEWTPRRTTDHVYAKGPNDNKLIGIWDWDKGKAANMNRTRIYQTPEWGLSPAAVPPVPTAADTPDTPIKWTTMGPQLDLDMESINKPLTVEEQRANSYYLSQSQGNSGDSPSAAIPVASTSHATSSAQIDGDPIDPEARVKAMKSTFENNYKNHLTQVRQLHTLADGMEPYRSPKIPAERLAEKEERLRAANSAALRQRMAAGKKQFGNSVYTKERKERLEAARARGDVGAAMSVDELGEILMSSELVVEDEMIVHEDEPENSWPPPGADHSRLRIWTSCLPHRRTPPSLD